jgi:hypothetical protein
LVPSGVTAMINIFNAKQFLEEGKFVPRWAAAPAVYLCNACHATVTTQHRVDCGQAQLSQALAVVRRVCAGICWHTCVSSPPSNVC